MVPDGPPDQDLTCLLGWPEPRNYALPSRPQLTDKGRRALAMEALFGRQWPTVAEAFVP